MIHANSGNNDAVQQSSSKILDDAPSYHANLAHNRLQAGNDGMTSSLDTSSSQLTIFLLLGGVCAVIVAMVFALRYHRKSKQPKEASLTTHYASTINCSPLPPLSLHEHQPQPVCEQPIRIRTRGLLERRGSSTSLTIDLSSNDSTAFAYGTPPKECSTEDYLSSAGNRLSRRQLRAVLNNVSVLHQEFLDIPLNHPSKSSMTIPGCGHKNRYKTILPNERTRVVLRMAKSGDTMNGDDSRARTYINANYIRGYDDEPMAFIATQGPLPNTIDDFWSMVWQEKATIIVMMTKLNEKNKNKCESYIPAQAQMYGDVNVQVVSCIPMDGYYIRNIQLTCNQQIRQLRHYWFTAWPDQAAPTDTARQLIALVSDVQAYKHQCRQKYGLAHVGPTVVHCSAGIGRTGCFIGIAVGMRQLCDENNVDVLGIVCQMRLDRGGMIQTPEQYEFVHHTLALYDQLRQ